MARDLLEAGPADGLYQRDDHRRSTNTEGTAKVVAAVWGTQFIQFLAALAILHYMTIFKNRTNSSFSLNHPGAIHPIIQSVLAHNS